MSGPIFVKKSIFISFLSSFAITSLRRKEQWLFYPNRVIGIKWLLLFRVSMTLSCDGLCVCGISR